jgi:hypothetical protein
MTPVARVAAAPSSVSSGPHVAVLAVVGLVLVAVVTAVAAVFVPRLRRVVGRVLGLAVAGALGLYLVGRGIAEFWVVHYSDPASYRDAWGGPSLVGVFVVHSGPGFLVLVGGLGWLWQRHRGRRRPPRASTTLLMTRADAADPRSRTADRSAHRS